MAALAALLASFGVGCTPNASERAGVSSAVESDPSRLNWAVMSTPDVRAASPAYGAELDSRRFEFARRDADLNVSVQVPLSARDQWPQPYTPPERPIRFHVWQQR